MTTQDIFNYLKVDEQISTGGQPSEMQIQDLAKEGFQAIINLATYTPGHSLRDEAGLVQSLGMDYRPIPVEWQSPMESDFVAFESSMSQLEGKKILIHCAANYRVTAFYSLYAMKHLGWTEEQADEWRALIWEGSEYPTWETFIQRIKEKL